MLPAVSSLPLPWRFTIKSGITSFTIENAPTSMVYPLVNKERYELLEEMKNYYSHKDFHISMIKTNPYEIKQPARFINRAVLKLAAIDAAYHLLESYPSKIFRFADVAGGPGSFTEYLFFRKPDSIGYGITLKGDLDWQLSKKANFNIFYGPDNTGDILKNWSAFVDQVGKDSVELMVADGGFDIKEQYSQQETLSFHLILVEALIGLLIVRPGYDMIIKIFDTVTLPSAQLLYILSNCFEFISIYKPLTSRPANSERYLVCEQKKILSDEYGSAIDLLIRSAKNYTLGNSILKEELSTDFLQWLVRTNNDSVELQLTAGQRILLALNGMDVPEINFDKNKLLKDLKLERREPMC